MLPYDVSEIASCEADITFFAERHHPDTREWFFDDFYRWFENPGESRAYVLLGDAGVGKSVMAGVLAKKSAAKGNLAAAYFCRDRDDTRNNPRYLLGTIACKLCKCNAPYSNFVGGEGGIRKLLGNSEIGIQGLFTKLLEEPLTKCSIPCERKLIVIDALDETKYESREDFLDIIKRRFPMLPEWLVFFITSRPVDAVQFRFKNYNPCIKICAGNSENLEFYRQHEQDIKLFLEKSVDFSLFPYSADDVVEKCKGMFLCAFHIVKDLNAVALSGEIVQLDDVFQGDIQDYFLKVQELVVVEETRHLEFRPDSKFLFFGWLRKMFSLQQGCVIELPQFANNNHCYDWGSFIFDGQYVVVESRYPSKSLCQFCLFEIFHLWAAIEIQLMDSSEFESLCNLLEGEEVLPYFKKMRQFGVKSLFFMNLRPHGDSLCKECLSFKQRFQETSTSLVRQRVLDLYADIFPTQVWNVNTGKTCTRRSVFRGCQVESIFLYLSFDPGPAFHSGGKFAWLESTLFSWCGCKFKRVSFVRNSDNDTLV